MAVALFGMSRSYGRHPEQNPNRLLAFGTTPLPIRGERFTAAGAEASARLDAREHEQRDARAPRTSPCFKLKAEGGDSSFFLVDRPARLFPNPSARCAVTRLRPDRFNAEPPERRVVGRIIHPVVASW